MNENQGKDALTPNVIHFVNLVQSFQCDHILNISNLNFLDAHWRHRVTLALGDERGQRQAAHLFSGGGHPKRVGAGAVRGPGPLPPLEHPEQTSFALF